MFKTNYFKYKNSFYKQIKGIAMGSIAGPSTANIYIYILEKKWLYIHRASIYIYKRFIDDILMVLKSKLDFENFEKHFIYLKLTKSYGDKVNFLDLNICFNSVTQKLDFSVYTKPTNNFSYLRPISNHPEHIFKNIPKSLFIRNRRICSEYFNYINISKTHIDQLLKRGYQRIKLIKLCKTIGNIDRDSLLPYKEKQDFFNTDKKSILFIHKFNFNLDINKIVYLSFNQFPSFSSDFKLLYINKMNCNLNNALVHNFKLNKILNYKTSKCLEPNCNTCKFIYKHKHIHIKDYNIKINLLTSTTCNTKNIIYVILCCKCDVFYVGETSKSLKERFSQHINHILNFKPYLNYYNKEVPKHFRKKYPQHTFKDLKVCIFNSNFNDSLTRKEKELDLVNFLNTNKKRCINKITSTKSNNLIFN